MSAERAVIDDDLSWSVVQLTLACAEFDSHDAQFVEMLLPSHGGHSISNDNGNRYPSMEQRADKKQ